MNTLEWKNEAERRLQTFRNKPLTPASIGNILGEVNILIKGMWDDKYKLTIGGGHVTGFNVNFEVYPTTEDIVQESIVYEYRVR